jgi:PPP family 3-phenylpropionic acid transporter
MNQNNPKLFAPILGAYYLFYFALVGVYIIFIPKALSDLGYNASQIGIIYAAGPFMRFLLPFVFKYFIPLNLKIYQISLAIMLISTIAFITAIDTFWVYFLSNLIFGASMGISLPFVETIALGKLSKHRYGKVRLWGSIGFMAIALWVGKILTNPYHTIYYLIGMALFVVIFGFLVVKYDDVKHSSTQEDSEFNLSKYWAFWASVFLMQVAFGGFYNFFTIYETNHGISLELTSWMWSFGVICEIVMLYFQGPLLEKNLLNVIKFSILITSFRWFMLYLYPDSIVIAFATQSLHAFSFALYHTASINYVYLLYTQKKLAQQFFLGIAFGLGGSIGAILAGKVYGEYLFLIESIITLFAFLAIILHQRRKEYVV